MVQEYVTTRRREIRVVSGREPSNTFIPQEHLPRREAEVENSEPAVRESAGHWRRATLDYLYAFWHGAARDGLLPPDTDVEWLAATTAVLSAAESRLLISRTFGWDAERYRQWLVRTWLELAARP